MTYLPGLDLGLGLRDVIALESTLILSPITDPYSLYRTNRRVHHTFKNHIIPLP
jgi:hypothetical protein